MEGGYEIKVRSNTVHALYAWVSPSPRVRCLLASVTYLLTYKVRSLAYFGHSRLISH